MASGIFAILDDIAVLMDDVVVMSKLATKKTAGILGDDLAVNAEKATGFVASRELPVLWAITKGSFINKLIILPAVFLLSFYSPFAIKVILILGGLYLAYEGVHKIFESIFHKKNNQGQDETDRKIEITDNEKEKIKSAITTDFILSLEIVIISLSTVLEKSLTVQILTVSVVALIATVGVYGLVALIVRMDDFGLFLISKSRGNAVLISIGNGFINVLPKLIRLISIIGTLALILVAGGIFIHNIDYIHHMIPKSIPSIVADFIIGFLGGVIALLVATIIGKIFKK